MAQAERDKPEGARPVVAHRKNGTEWLITMRAEDWIKVIAPESGCYHDLIG